MGVPNPDSDDGVVPALNPIDETLMNADAKVYAGNIDLFIEHGSIPSGANPDIKMPAFGDLKLLDSQKIADLIAYVMSINSVK
jgi:mono/diheme cytochrome c family protein